VTHQLAKGLLAVVVVVALGCKRTEPSKVPTTDTSGTTEDPTTEPPDDTGDGFHDSLSMPATPTVSLSAFSGSDTCAECHPTHHNQWRQSVHAAAMHDPVFQGLVYVRQADLAGAEDPFCTQCHSMIGTRSLDISSGFSFDALDPITMEGVNCESCHRVSEVSRTHNAGLVLDPTGPMRGPIADPAPSTHHTSETVDFLGEASFCGSCHDVIETSGLPLERPYEEWLASPAADDDRPCQSCHMPESTGIAGDGGPERTLHDHRFVGVDVPLVEGFLTEDEEAELRSNIDALLQSSGTVLLTLPAEVHPGHTLDIVATVRNELDAHNLPTGSTFNRQLWLEVTVTDATGRLVYETGTLDDNGDLRDRWSDLDAYGDNDLVQFSSGFIDATGTPTLFTHRATEHTSKALQPLHERTVTLFAPIPNDAIGPLDVSARLRFRPYGPYLLRLLELDAWLDHLQITDIDAHSGQVALSSSP
jgi:hypothetical protein